MALYYGVTFFEGMFVLFGANMVGSLATGFTIIEGGGGCGKLES